MVPDTGSAEWLPLNHALALTGGGVVTLVGAGGKTTLMFALAKQLAALEGSVLTTTTTKIEPPTPTQSIHLIEARHAGALLTQLDRLESVPSHLTTLAPAGHPPEKRAGLTSSDIDIIAASGRFRWIIVEGDGAARKPLKAPADHEPVIPTSSRHVVLVAGLDSLGRPLTEKAVHRADRFAALSGLALGAPVTAEALARVVNHPAGGRKGVPEGARLTLFLNKADRFAWQSAADGIHQYLMENGGMDLSVVAGSAQAGIGWVVSY
jgi:probable selenium-dependent hydroxylase accessory protein YqeC